MPFQPFYPDVLGAITGGPRINMDALETAIGIYPKQAYVNQPMEVVIVLQSMVNKEMQVKVAIRVPSEDRKGQPVFVETAKSQMSVNLSPGEVGVLRMPLIAYPPTNPGRDLPVRVAIRYRVRDADSVRPPGGGGPPSVLSVSPFKLQVLREVEFIAHKWNESTDIMTVYFDIVPKNFPGSPALPPPSYEILWQQESMAKEIRLARSHYQVALGLAKPSPTGMLYLSLMDAVEERFAAHDMPLHPGETMAIAKMMAYTVEDAPGREPGVELEETRWFRALCQVIAADPNITDDYDRNDILSHFVFESVIYEAILLAFNVLRHNVRENFGDRAEQLNYANKFMKWITGHGTADLSYVYLPLVLGGVAVARLVRGPFSENEWEIVDQLEEAVGGRVHLDEIKGEAHVIFDILDFLLDAYRKKLRSQRISRPDE